MRLGGDRIHLPHLSLLPTSGARSGRVIRCCTSWPYMIVYNNRLCSFYIYIYVYAHVWKWICVHWYILVSVWHFPRPCQVAALTDAGYPPFIVEAETFSDIRRRISWGDAPPLAAQVFDWKRTVNFGAPQFFKRNTLWNTEICWDSSGFLWWFWSRNRDRSEYPRVRTMYRSPDCTSFNLGTWVCCFRVGRFTHTFAYTLDITRHC